MWYTDGEDGQGHDQWSRGNNGEDSGLWDDVGGNGSKTSGKGPGGGLDLADFAAAALQFHTTTRDLGLADQGPDAGPRVEEEDPMERLLKEQTDELHALEGDEDDAG